MPKLKLTQSVIEGLQPPPYKVKPDGSRAPSQVIYMDTAHKGLGVRITSGGKKAFIAEKWTDNKPVRVTLGDAEQISLAKAWNEAQKVFGKLAEGTNPIQERRAEAAKAVTLEEVLEDYMEARKNLSERTRYDYRRLVDTYLDAWKKRPIASISKDQVEKRHADLGKNSAAQANYTMRVFRALVNFAMEKYEVEGAPILVVNPVVRLSRAKAWYDVKRRKTYISPDQLKPWFDAVLKVELSRGRDYMDVARDYLQLVILTGLRKNEGLGVRWEDVDMENRHFTVRGTKNGEDHTLPMSDYVHALFQHRLERRRKGQSYVFPGIGEKDVPQTEPKKAIIKVIEASGVDFTMHDLRRTFITVAESLDISAYAVKRLVNHKMSNDVTAGYIVTDVERLRKPMQQITDFILARAGVRKGAEVTDLGEARAKRSTAA